MFTTKTTSGTEVQLEALANGDVRLTWSHPLFGNCQMATAKWATRKGQSGAVGVALADKGGVKKTLPDVCVTIPRADFDRALASARAMKTGDAESILAAIRSGETRIELAYHDGEYLSGHGVHGPAAELLVGLGIAKYVEGWGVCVDAAAVRALGESFTYPEAAAYAAPAIAGAEAAAEERKTAREAKLAAARDEAVRTGHPVVLSRWYSHDTGEESVYVTETIDGDGKITTSSHGE